MSVFEVRSGNVVSVARHPNGDPLYGALEVLGFGDAVRSGNWSDADLERLPFLPGDVTAGSESELQTAVLGDFEDVDLPQQILDSNYYGNIAERVRHGGCPGRAVSGLESFVKDNHDGVWENSWVRFPLTLLNRSAWEQFDHDLLADKRDKRKGKRSDYERFFLEKNNECWLRVPISYLLKLSLAQLLDQGTDGISEVKKTLRALMPHFLNDNSSPETISFFVSRPAGRAHRDEQVGQAVSRETRKRFLLTHLLLEYANEVFQLGKFGQRAIAYYSPHAPVRLHDLNNSVSDSFFRELFLSPCLSGWDRGEEKFQYMRLCHQVLSRSRLNGLTALRESSILLNNLVVLPHTSNLGLANNGTHVSLGSERLDTLISDPNSGFNALHEKVLGDLNIKITEHFLPLFAGLYSAAPYRLDYRDFHPETALGFLPHELHYSHLRMFWRTWKSKAGMSLSGMGRDLLTPMGPRRVDDFLARIFRQKGDWVPDYRVIDYLMALGSTDRSPALDGTPGNQQRLLTDLDQFGIFDQRMSLYMLYKQRIHAEMGFSGFEARYFSLFADLEADLSQAVNLQALISALAVKLIASGKVGRGDIPDTRHVESERRQFFFASATDLRAVYVRDRKSSKVNGNAPNLFLMRILKYATRTRHSRRYRGYLKVYLDDYRQALLRFIEAEASDLIEAMGMRETLVDLRMRLEHPATHGVASRLSNEITRSLGISHPKQVNGRSFNSAAERFYRTTLSRQHVASGLDVLEQDLRTASRCGTDPLSALAAPGAAPGTPDEPVSRLRQVREQILNAHASKEDLEWLIASLVRTIKQDISDQHRSTDSVVAQAGGDR